MNPLRNRVDRPSTQVWTNKTRIYQLVFLDKVQLFSEGHKIFGAIVFKVLTLLLWNPIWRSSYLNAKVVCLVIFNREIHFSWF